LADEEREIAERADRAGEPPLAWLVFQVGVQVIRDDRLAATQRLGQQALRALRIAVIGFYDFTQRTPAVGCDCDPQPSGRIFYNEPATTEKAAGLDRDPAELGEQ